MNTTSGIELVFCVLFLLLYGLSMAFFVVPYRHAIRDMKAELEEVYAALKRQVAETEYKRAQLAGTQKLLFQYQVRVADVMSDAHLEIARLREENDTLRRTNMALIEKEKYNEHNT